MPVAWCDGLSFLPPMNALAATGAPWASLWPNATPDRRCARWTMTWRWPGPHPAAQPALWPLREGGCRWLSDAVRLSRRISTLPPDQLRRDHRSAGAGGGAAGPNCAGWDRGAFHQG